jgi:hypothetical protein
MVSTQHVREKMWYEAKQGMVCGFDSQKSGGYVYAKASKCLSKLQYLKNQKMDHATESIVEDRPNQQIH